MYKITIVLLSLLAAIQYPLWFGKGGYFRRGDIEAQLKEQRAMNVRLKRRNAQLAGDVRDLKEGMDFIEERARYEFGLIRRGEVLFQFIDEGN